MRDEPTGEGARSDPPTGERGPFWIVLRLVLGQLVPTVLFFLVVGPPAAMLVFGAPLLVHVGVSATGASILAGALAVLWTVVSLVAVVRWLFGGDAA